jgi:hypothetical protein
MARCPVHNIGKLAPTLGAFLRELMPAARRLAILVNSNNPGAVLEMREAGAEDGIGGVAGAAFEIATAEMTFCLHVADHRVSKGAR